MNTWLLISLALAAPALSGNQDKHPKSKIKWQSEFGPAAEQAKKEGKLLLVHFGAEWCTWCKKMDGDAFADEAVGQICSKGFVSVEVDVDKKTDLVKKYLVERVPTALVLLPEGEIVDVLDGYAPAQEFKAWLGPWSEAYARYLEAVEKSRRKPEDREAVCHLAESLLELNQPGRAASSIESALASLPKGTSLTPEARKAKAELLVHLGDAYLDLGESPKKLLETAKGIDDLDPGGKLGFEVHAIFLRAAVDDILAHELEEEAEDLEKQGKKGPAGKKRSEARKLQAIVLERLEDCLGKYPQSDRTDAILVWVGHLQLEVRNDTGAARKAYEKVLEKFPKSAFADEARQKLRDLAGEKPKSEKKKP